MRKRPKILVAGILDTKGNEVKYIAERVKVAGGDPTIFEVSVGKEVGWADISLSEVISNADINMDNFLKLGKTDRVNIIIKGGIKLVDKLIKDGKVDGIVATGGSMGASILTSIMQTMPIGMPKLMLTTMASGNTGIYVGTKDISMMYPIAEVGINTVTRKILNNAAGSIVGMCSIPKAVAEGEKEKPLIGCTMLGVTTPTVLWSEKYFENKGYDVMINHATGSGGKSMEELISDGYIAGILDVTTWEITNHIYHQSGDAGPNRLTAASKKGIPQVVSVGGLDLFVFAGSYDVIPENYKKDIQNKIRGFYSHNPMVQAVATTVDEVYATAKIIGEKLNMSTNHTVICIPMRGFGAYDSAIGLPQSGWTEEKDSPNWIPDPENPRHSLRAKYFIKGIKETIDINKDNLDILLVDRHLNEPEFAKIMCELLDEMLSGKWEKGSHHNLPEILDF